MSELLLDKALAYDWLTSVLVVGVISTLMILEATLAVDKTETPHLQCHAMVN